MRQEPKMLYFILWIGKIKNPICIDNNFMVDIIFIVLAVYEKC